MMTETVVNVQEAPNNNATKPQPGGGAPRQGTNESPVGWIKINIEYFKTTPGILKLVEFIFGILCMALASPAYYSGTHFFLFVATTSFIFTILWIFIYLLGIREALKLPINWILSELVNTGFWAILYIVAFIVQLIIASGTHPILYFRDAYIAAGVFGLFNAIVYCFATYLLYVEMKRNQTTN
ncbi:CKLF-like MARVEL transmembrane domain-containing protein 4 [Diorhabda sublineata]|uniref:CKLF-like MARVEL transmembrane domain-containing protein 4 n=1 Tax=Diorhabda sublineata TaxID=1163346 RepID=UPI0024E065D8|nr:CKLF-like MARVEL transmembrane domain-containing protein 4 [Diorhabda sublineata]